MSSLHVPDARLRPPHPPSDLTPKAHFAGSTVMMLINEGQESLAKGSQPEREEAGLAPSFARDPSRWIIGERATISHWELT